jgi:hypothetical protein
MWLKTTCTKEILDYGRYDTNGNTLKAFLLDDNIAPISNKDKNARVSKIFPLLKDAPLLETKNCFIHFFEYDKPYRVLGKLLLKAPRNLQERIFFNIGLCSVILIVENERDYDDYLSLKDIDVPVCHEYWKIHDSVVIDMQYTTKPEIFDREYDTITDYKALPLNLCAILDETVISIQMIKDKAYNDQHIALVNGLISKTNDIINCLLFIEKPAGIPPEVLRHVDICTLSDRLTKQNYQNSLCERLIQINSALSYVSTQSFSGAIPIYERRSLIRRNSLLGIGSAIGGLNNVFQYVENAFNTVDFEWVIRRQMSISSPLNGISRGEYNAKGWENSNVDKLYFSEVTCANGTKTNRLSYFSSIHSFRESEICITAALSSLYMGVSLEWSLMTLTHEIIHSHIRRIVACVFDFRNQEQGDAVINKYLSIDQNAYSREHESGFYLIDSIREAILMYCDHATTMGSLSRVPKPGLLKSKSTTKDTVRENLARENRNIQEIFVHVLDLHYFYRGRAGLSEYITLIWCSWAVIPNVRNRLGQYILRSLLTIASTLDIGDAKSTGGRDELQILNSAKGIFLEIINGLPKGIINRFPLFGQIKNDLEDDSFAKKYFSRFANSLLLVDVIKRVFYSETVYKNLWGDANISYQDEPIPAFEFAGKEEFNDMPIESLAPFMLHQVLQTYRRIVEESDIVDAEREAAVCYLALKSN